jgi:chorismate mutase
MSAVRGVRGATTVRANDAAAVTDATLELLRVMRDRNAIKPEDIGYVWFTVTPDLDAAFPADAARAGMGWTDVPLICGREIPVPGALPLCVRVLIAWNTTLAQRDVKHAFLHGARALRPAWAVDLPTDAKSGRPPSGGTG